MKISKIFHWIFFACLSVLLFGYIGPGKAGQETSEVLVPQQRERTDVIYYCQCAQPCDCPTASIRPGKAACGKKYEKGHILKIEGSEAIICQNSSDCRCYPVDPLDPAKCTCGLPTRRVRLAGSGIYFCNCGSSCYCNYVSASPGTCKCGMNLIWAE